MYTGMQLHFTFDIYQLWKNRWWHFKKHLPCKMQHSSLNWWRLNTSVYKGLL